jgi:hypothetical protein
LAGTRFAEKTEWCPTLSDAMPSNLSFLPPAYRDEVEAEIAKVRGQAGKK